ncbi:MAG: hypothetical protein AAFQ82_24735 [Myxococcota bacterium]
MSGDNERPSDPVGSLDAEATLPVERPKRRLSGELTVPISSGSREPTEIFRPDALEAKAVQGPIRRNLPLILAVLMVLAVGPAVSRLITHYRAVVLEVKDGQMLMIEGRTPPPPPRWISAVPVEPGAIVEKQVGQWSPAAASAGPDDRTLLSYHERWARSYQGVITKIRPPLSPDGPSVAVLQLTDGTTLEVSLWSQDLASAAVGKGLEKRPGSWGPELMVTAPSVTPPSPGTAPDVEQEGAPRDESGSPEEN